MEPIVLRRPPRRWPRGVLAVACLAYALLEVALRLDWPSHQPPRELAREYWEMRVTRDRYVHDPGCKHWPAISRRLAQGPSEAELRPIVQGIEDEYARCLAGRAY